jgi:hypothetical protein
LVEFYDIFGAKNKSVIEETALLGNNDGRHSGRATFAPCTGGK